MAFSHQVIMLIASGRRSGEMINTELDSFEIGTGASCLVQASCTDVHSANAGPRVRVTRQAEGWFAEPVSGSRFFLGQKTVTSAVKLRSGDFIRLGHRGDDFQFRLQTSARTIEQVFAAHLPSQLVEANEADRRSENQPKLEEENNDRKTVAISDQVATKAKEHASAGDRKTTLVGENSLPDPVQIPVKSWAHAKTWNKRAKNTVPPVVVVLGTAFFVVLLAVIALLVFLALNQGGGS